MGKFLVTVAVSGTQYFEVEAENESAAWDNWYDGESTGFEPDDYDVVDVEEIEN